MKKMALLLLLGISVQSLAWAQGAPVKLDVPKGVEKNIEKDCASEALDAFLQAGNKPVNSIAGFQLKQVICSFDSATLVYKKSNHELGVTLKDNQGIVRLSNQAGTVTKGGQKNGLAERQVKMQKANLQIHEDNIRAFEELKKKFPEAAAKQEKNDPPPGKYTLPSGDTLYFKRRPCEDKCGVVEANAMAGGGRYYFQIHAEHDGASLSQQAAEGFVKEIAQTVKWDKLR